MIYLEKINLKNNENIDDRGLINKKNLKYLNISKNNKISN